MIDGFFNFKFPILCCDNAVIKVWLGLDPQQNTMLELGKIMFYLKNPDSVD